MTTDTKNPQYEGWGSEARKFIPSLVLTVLVGFGSSWVSNQVTQNEMRYRLEAAERRLETMAAQQTTNAATINQMAVRQAEMTVVHANIVEQLKELRDEQRQRR